jgi:Tfp pilus assembly protein FimT
MSALQNERVRKCVPDRGFTTLELSIAVLLTLAVTVMAAPSLRNTMNAYRGTGAVQTIASQLSLSRMRAAASFTRSRINLDTAHNTYHRELFDKSSGTYQRDGADQFLAQGVSFGFGSITAPAGGQSSILQSDQVIINSRGIPVDSAGTPTGEDAVYLNYEGRYYAVTVNTAGQIRTWKYSGTTWVEL